MKPVIEINGFVAEWDSRDQVARIIDPSGVERFSGKGVEQILAHFVGVMEAFDKARGYTYPEKPAVDVPVMVSLSAEKVRRRMDPADCFVRLGRGREVEKKS